MKLTARIARRTLKTRRAELPKRTEVRRAIVRPHSIASHLISTGVTPTVASNVASSLHTVAKRLSVVPVLGRTERTAAGAERRERVVHRYNRDQMVAMVQAYHPRKTEYKNAVQIFLNA